MNLNLILEKCWNSHGNNSGTYNSHAFISINPIFSNQDLKMPEVK